MYTGILKSLLIRKTAIPSLFLFRWIWFGLLGFSVLQGVAGLTCDSDRACEGQGKQVGTALMDLGTSAFKGC
jgi:hypothetical protein